MEEYCYKKWYKYYGGILLQKMTGVDFLIKVYLKKYS